RGRAGYCRRSPDSPWSARRRVARTRSCCPWSSPLLGTDGGSVPQRHRQCKSVIRRLACPQRGTRSAFGTVLLSIVPRDSQARMDLPNKTKMALDETRMMILGAQILLGFQLRSAFGEGFDRLAADARYLDAAALGLMVIT